MVPLREAAYFQEGPGLRTRQWTTEGMKVINVTNILGDGSVDVSNTDKFIALNEFETRYAHFAVEENDIVREVVGDEKLVAACDGNHRPDCPIIDSLEGDLLTRHGHAPS